jgi:phage portal protein BeeE
MSNLRAAGGWAGASDYWYQPLGWGQPVAGQQVTPDTALATSAVWSCTWLIAESVAMLPLNVYQYRRGGGKDYARDHPVFDLLHDQPNPWQTAVEFRDMMQGHVLLRGNAYALIVPGPRGPVDQLIPLHPDRMRVEQLPDRSIRYSYQPQGMAQRVVYLEDEIFHLRGPSSDGVMGLSIISAARKSLGLALAAEDYGGRYFGNGSRPGGVLTTAGKLSPGAAEDLKLRWEQAYGGANAHRVAVLEEGLSWQQMGLSNEDSQFLACVVPGTPVTMADGTRMAVEALRPGDEVVGWRDGPVSARVHAVGLPRVKPLVRITTARGRELIASADHPCLARERLRTPGNRVDDSPDSWVPLSAVKPGMLIRVGLGHVPQPDALSTDRAWMLGAMTGDGYIRTAGFSFCNADAGVIQEMDRVAVTMGGGLSHATSRPYDWNLNTGGTRGRGGSEIRSLFNESGLVGKHSHSKRVPDAVLRGGPSAWRGFLSGYLDTDGSVRDPDGRQTPAVYWSSVSRPLLEDCQHLLSMLGIQSAIYRMQLPGRRMFPHGESPTLESWGLYVMGTMPLRLLAHALVPHHPDKRRRLARYGNLPPSRYSDRNFFYDRVTSVEPLPPGPTIGVEIEDVHTHITGGLVTHNTREFQVVDVARWFRVPPHMIGTVDRSTSWGTGIEQMSVGFVAFTLMPWLTRWEQKIQQRLLTNGSYFARHQVQALMRGDTATRFAAYAIGRQWGFLSVNDIRALEDMNPVEGGDEYLVPLNMAPLGTTPPGPQGTDARADLEELRALVGAGRNGHG